MNWKRELCEDEEKKIARFSKDPLNFFPPFCLLYPRVSMEPIKTERKNSVGKRWRVGEKIATPKAILCGSVAVRQVADENILAASERERWRIEADGSGGRDTSPGN